MTNLPIESAFPSQEDNEDKYGLNATMNQIHEIILNKIEEVTQGRNYKLIENQQALVEEKAQVGRFDIFMNPSKLTMLTTSANLSEKRMMFRKGFKKFFL